jgi:3-isopropylmalate dehydrogenase
MIQGGLGVAAGGNINPDKGGVSMFEPMGGSAPKYTGQNVINPDAIERAAINSPASGPAMMCSPSW